MQDERIGWEAGGFEETWSSSKVCLGQTQVTKTQESICILSSWQSLNQTCQVTGDPALKREDLEGGKGSTHEEDKDCWQSCRTHFRCSSGKTYCKLHELTWCALTWRTESSHVLYRISQSLGICQAVGTNNCQHWDQIKRSEHSAQPLCSQFKRTQYSFFRNHKFLSTHSSQLNILNFPRAQTLKAISPFTWSWMDPKA